MALAKRTLARTRRLPQNCWVRRKRFAHRPADGSFSLKLRNQDRYQSKFNRHQITNQGNLGSSI